MFLNKLNTTVPNPIIWRRIAPLGKAENHVHRPPWIVSPDSKVHGANMGPIWGRQDPGGSHVGPMNLAIWVFIWDKSMGK